jgi:intracellular multiplication protein IcmL
MEIKMSKENKNIKDDIKSDENKSPVDSVKSKEYIHEKIVIRNRSLRYIHKQLIVLTLWSTCVAAVAIIVAIIGFQTKLPPQYIPVTEEGRLLPIIPLSRASVDDSEIGAFTIEAIKSINTFDYINWRNQLPLSADYFIPKAWTAFMDELSDRKTLNAILDRKMIVTPNIISAPEVVRQGVDGGIYTWQVEIDVRIDYRAHVISTTGGVDSGNRQEGTIRLIIQRVPSTINSRGIAIQSYLFIPTKAVE